MHYTIARGVYAVGGFELSGQLDNRVYLIDLKEYLVLIDSGSIYGFEHILRNIMELGYQPTKIKYVILTHAHIESSGGGYYFYLMFPNVVTVAHEPDATMIRLGDPVYTNACMYNVRYLSYPISISLRDDVIRYRVCDEPLLEIIHTPGHTAGSVSVLFEGGGIRILFISDALGPLCEKWGSSLDKYIESINRILEYKADLYCTSTQCYNRAVFVELCKRLLEDARKGLLWVECCTGK